MKPTIRVSLLLLLLALTACTGDQPTATTAPTLPPTETPRPALPPTWTPAPPPTATPEPSPTPFVPFEATVLVDYVNIRENPGSLFGILKMINVGEKFQVLAQAPGGEWFYIQLADGKNGWVFNKLIDTDQDLAAAPIRQPADVILVTGSVFDLNNRAISGITFNIAQGTGSTAKTTVAITDASGTFYAFLPAESTGKWYAAYSGIACPSTLLDANCDCIGGNCGTIDPQVVNVLLPQSEPLLFTLK